MKNALRVYVASRLENAENVKTVYRRLREIGCDITYDWTTHGSVGHLGAARVAEVATLEAKAVEKAGTVIVLLPGGRGTHVELGISITLGTVTIVHSEDPSLFDCVAGGSPCAFYFARPVFRVVSPLEWFITNLESIIDRAGDFRAREVRVTADGKVVYA